MAGRHRPLPAMVLVDRHVRLVDEIKGVIQETGEPPLGEAMEPALRKTSSWNEQERDRAVRKEVMRYRAVEKRAYEVLRQRKQVASRRPGAVRKEPVTFGRGDDDYFNEILEGLEPCLSEVADAPGVTCLSLNISWHPSHPLWRGGSASTFISSCHGSLLVLCVGNCRPGNSKPGFYLVYNTRANSVAIVPPLPPSRSHWDIAGGLGGAAVLCLGTTTDKWQGRDDYLLAELLLRRDGRPTTKAGRPTTKATLFTWEAAFGSQWFQRVVDLPLPPPAADQDYSFCADMVFPVGSTVLCWVDLLSGILLYKHTSKQQTCFHFIALPPGYAADNPCELREQMCPQEVRSMCCVNEETLKFVSMDGYDQQDIPMARVKLTVWMLCHPLSSTKSEWKLSRSINIGDFWHNRSYNNFSLTPSFPVISTLKPDVIYVSVTEYKYNHKDEMPEATSLYVLSLDMGLRSVVSSFKVPSDEDGVLPDLRIFTSHFASYLSQTRGDFYKEYLTWKEVADKEESRNDPAVWTSLWIARGKEVRPTRWRLSGASQHLTAAPSTPYGASSTRKKI